VGPDSALKCVLDFTAVGSTLRGKLTPAHFRDPLAEQESYRVLKDPKDVAESLAGASLLSIDTETYGDLNNTPYMVQFSTSPGTGNIVYANNASCLAVIANHVAQTGNTTIMHNALFDLLVLEKLGIFPADVKDTMIMAYLLQSEPLGLKPLAFRYWGMTMLDYEDIIAEASSDLAFEYLLKVKDSPWPMPDKIMEIKPGGIIHYKQPQNIIKVVDRMLKDYAQGKIQKSDLWDRWHKLDEEETSRGLVESILGEMPEGNLSMIDEKTRHWYAARDPDATIRIYPYLWSRLQDQNMEDVFNMDMAIVPMVLDMMRRGIKPDREALVALGNRFGAKVKELTGQIHGLAGRQFNIGSWMQVADLLFNQLKIKFKFKHGKVTTNDKTMARIVAAHPVVPLIRQWRQYNKLETTYTSKLPKWIAEDGRIHTKLGITGTATGRLTSAKPNLMNQPTRSEDGKAIRKCFVPSEGMVFVSNDLSQIEMRVLAHESGDPLLLDIFRNDKDIHSITASNIFKLPVDQLDDMRHRYPSKRVGFGVVYGITAAGLQEQLLMIGLDPAFWTIRRCQELIDEWFALYHDVEVYMHDLVRFAILHGYVEDMFGRRRYLATIESTSKQARAEAARQAGNMPIQSGAAGVFKKGMANLTPIYKDFQARGYRIWPIIPIHDDLVFEVEEDLVDIWVPIQQDVMEHSVQLRVPIKSDAKIGRISWGEGEKYKW
jgi:DNA polymerase I-like protein with 3'-5' exonuclease and polymerase domains